MKNSSLFRGIIFLLVLLIVICSVQGLFGLDDKRAHENVHGYTYEEKHSLDGVYFGASDVHAFWQPLFGWANHGIAVWNYSVDSIPVKAIKYSLIEAQKSQPDALFIFSLSTFQKDSAESSMEAIHRVIDYFPASINKLRMIDSLVSDLEYTPLEKLEFYFPIIRFHSRWSSLRPWVFSDSSPIYKSSIEYAPFLEDTTDVSGSYEIYDTQLPVPEEILELFNDLLNYCDEQNLNVLFVKPPQVVDSTRQGYMNTLENLLSERGYPCLDVLEDAHKIGLDFSTDFLDTGHANVHGSLKFSSYLADYLVENYGFEDKRGQDKWKRWDEALTNYSVYIGPYVLPFEFDHLSRFPSAVPKLHPLCVDSDGITVNWEGIDSADGYFIYRRFNGIWSLLDTVGAEIFSFRDCDVMPGAEYTYTVVPYCTKSEKILYGSFDINGLSCQTVGE